MEIEADVELLKEFMQHTHVHKWVRGEDIEYGTLGEKDYYACFKKICICDAEEIIKKTAWEALPLNYNKRW